MRKDKGTRMRRWEKTTLIQDQKQETSAPTVAIESMFLTSTIDAKERRYVVTTDIPGAFMQTDVDELIHVRLEGPLVALLAKVIRIYTRSTSWTRKGNPPYM
jgi:hypothetical protein